MARISSRTAVYEARVSKREERWRKRWFVVGADVPGRGEAGAYGTASRRKALKWLVAKGLGREEAKALLLEAEKEMKRRA